MQPIEFAKQFQVVTSFLSRTNQLNQLQGYLCRTLPELLSGIEKQSSVEFMDIGCRNGFMTVPVISALKEYVNSVSTTAIDTSPILLEQFQESHADQDIQFINEGWLEFNPPHKYDIIMCVHVLYKFPDWKLAIKKMMECRKEGGVICLVIRADDELLQFKNRFFPRLHAEQGKERDFSQLCSLLNEMNVFFEPNVVESELDISDLIGNDEQGQMIIEYVLRKSYEDIPKSVLLEIAQYWRAFENRRKIELRDGFVWIL